MKFYRGLCFFASAVLLLSFSSCSGEGQEDSIQNAPIFAVNTTTAVQGQIWDYISLSGDIISGSTVDVFSDMAGRVSRVYVEIGSRVSRGAAIVAVDPSRPGMYFIPAVATAPIAGTVVALPAQLGATVSQVMPLARISGNDALEIRLFVAERFISQVALNQLCEITLDAWPGEIFWGTVSELSPVIDPASRTMEIKVSVDNQAGRLKEGMFARVKLITEQKENIVKIPASALITRFGENYVFVIEEVPFETRSEEQGSEEKGFFASIFARFGRSNTEDPELVEPQRQFAARRRLVQPGIMIDGVLEITAGLRSGEEFIIRGQTLLNDGALINVIERVTLLSEER